MNSQLTPIRNLWLLALVALSYCSIAQHRFAVGREPVRNAIMVTETLSVSFDAADTVGYHVIVSNNMQFENKRLDTLLFGSQTLLVHSTDSGLTGYVSIDPVIKPKPLSSVSVAPIVINTGLTPNNLINNHFISGCVEISNVTYSGAPTARGLFSNGGNSIGFDSGIVLSTGNVNLNVPGPNIIGNNSDGFNFLGSDSDLNPLTSQNLYDVARLEFDFVAQSSMVNFEYVFASEEYCEFVNSAFNDVFGFFISGPGIPGGVQNIALLPGNQPVSINNVNHTTNSTFYKSNTPTGHPDYADSDCIGQPVATGSPPLDLEFDGLTTVLSASAQVQPCQTYHIKLVIADVGDGLWDSAVFLRGNSFNASGNITAQVVYANGSSAVEGCSQGYILLTRVPGSNINSPVTVNLQYSGSASAGTDYTPMPTSVTIPAGQNSVQVPFQALSDGTAEGNEFISVTLDNFCSCANNTLTINIADSAPLQIGLAPAQACMGTNVVLSPTVTVGVHPLSYSWSNGQTSDSITVPAIGNQTYTVTVTDACGSTASGVAQVTIIPGISATLSGNVNICGATHSGTLTVEVTPAGNYTLSYTVNGMPQSVTMSGSSFNLPVTEVGTYTLTSIQAASSSCPGTISGSGIVAGESVSVTASGLLSGCGSSFGHLTASATGTGAPFTYLWSNGAQSPNLNNIPVGTYTVTATGTLGCTATAQTSVGSDTNLEVAIAFLSHQTCLAGGSVNLAVTGGQPPYSYSWSNGLPGLAAQQGLSAGIYTVTVTEANGCTGTVSMQIQGDNDLPAASIEPNDYVFGCLITETTILTGSGSGGSGDLSLLWQGGLILSDSSSQSIVVGSPGTYTLLVTDNITGCIAQASISLPQVIYPPVGVIPQPDLLTCEVNQVTLDGSIFGLDYQFNWNTPNGNIVSGSQTPFPVVNAAGTYFVTVTEPQSGCSATESVKVFVDSTLPDITLSKSGNLSCLVTSVTLSSSFIFDGPVTYQWSTLNGNIISATDEPTAVVNLKGKYRLTVTSVDNPECFTLKHISVQGDTLWPTADAGADQSITCMDTVIQLNGLVGGTNDISWFWQTPDGSFVGAATGLNPYVDQAGLYILTATNNANNCSVSDTVIITKNIQQPLLQLYPNSTLTCAQPTSTVSVEYSSTGPQFTGLWHLPGGQTNSAQSLTVSTPGLYIYSLSDIVNGCSITDTVIVINQMEPPPISLQNEPVINCIQPSIELDLGLPHTIEFIYQWQATNGGILVESTTDGLPMALTAGVYAVTVTDPFNGCSTTSAVVVTDHTDFPQSTITEPQIWHCQTDSMTLQLVQTQPHYQYQWHTSNGTIAGPLDASDIVILSPGLYQVIVTDLTNGCSQTSMVDIPTDTIHPIPVFDPGFLGCISNTDSIIVTIANNDGGQYSYSWFSVDGNVTLDDTTPYVVVNYAGTFELTLSDISNGCTTVAQTVVNANYDTPAFVINPSLPITCASPTTLISAYIITPISDASWEFSGPSPNSIVSGLGTSAITVQDTGVYQLKVTNLSNGCFRNDTVHVTGNFIKPVALIEADDTLTCIQTSITLQGLADSPNMSYSWATTFGQINSDPNLDNIQVSLPGIYTLAVTREDNGCQDTAQLEVQQDIAQPQPLPVSSGPITCAQNTVTISATGDLSDLILNWFFNGLPVGDAATVNIDQAGTYFLESTDLSSGCKNLDTIVILENVTVPPVYAGPDVSLQCGTGQINLAANQGISHGLLLYQWTTDTGSFWGSPNQAAVVVNAAGTYTVSVTDPINGCSSTDALTVHHTDAAEPVSLTADGLLTCTQTSVELNATSADAVYFQWHTPVGIQVTNTASFTATWPGNYTVIAFNSGNCSASATLVVSIDTTQPNAVAHVVGELNCLNAQVELIGSSDVSAQFIWLGTSGEIIGEADTVVATQPGHYTLVVTHPTSGCTHTDSVWVIKNNETPQIVLLPGPTLTCVTTAATLSAINPSTTHLSYAWTSDGGLLEGDVLSPTVQVLEPGTYYLVVTDTLNGCSNTFSATVESNTLSPTILSVSATTITCNQPQATLSALGSSGGNSPVNYQWIDQTGQTLGYQSNMIVTQPGPYSLKLTNPHNGCFDTAQVVVVLDTLSPVVTINPPQPLSCTQPNTILTADVADADVYQIFWQTAGIAPVINGHTLKPTVSEATTYTLYVYNTLNGCSGMAQVTVQVDTLHPLTFAGNDDTLTCAHLQLMLFGSVTNITSSEIKYSWFTPNGHIASGSQTTNPVIDQPGDYEFTAINVANGCFDKDWVSIGIDTLFPAAAIIEPLMLTCTTTEITLNAISNLPSNALSYKWFGPSGPIITGVGQSSVNTSQPGNYLVEITLMSNGCVAQAHTNVEQNLSHPTVDAGQDQVLPCDTPTVRLSGMVLGHNVESHWMLNNTPVASNETQIEISQAGWYILEALNTSNGCLSRDSVEVSLPPLGQAHVTEMSPKCNEQYGNITIDSVTGGTAPFQYRLNDYPYYPTNKFLKLEPGAYTVFMRDAYGCTDTQFVSIDPPPVYTAEAEASANSIKLGEEVTLTATTNLLSSDIVSIQWHSPQTPVMCNDCYIATATPSVNSIFYVTFTTPEGCQAVAHTTVIVDTLPDLWFPTSFSPNGDGLNDLFYPLANQNEWMIQEIALFQIFDRWGTLHHEVRHFLPNDPAYGWDGTSKGLQLAPAVFTWQAEVIFIDGRRWWLSGDLTLLR